MIYGAGQAYREGSPLGCDPEFGACLLLSMDCMGLQKGPRLAGGVPGAGAVLCVVILLVVVARFKAFVCCL